MVMWPTSLYTLQPSKRMVPPKRLPIKGSFIGNRNSWLNMTTASPPIGKPVHGSRGPASFRPKPRSVVAPPAKNRSGKGLTCSGGGGVVEVQFVEPPSEEP